jgi:hypothetical protein
MPVTGRRVIGILAAMSAVLGTTVVTGQNNNPNERQPPARRAPTPPPANPQHTPQQQRPQQQQQQQQQQPQQQRVQQQRVQPQQFQPRQQQLQPQQRQPNSLQRPSTGPRAPGPRPVISDRGGPPHGFHPVGPSRTEIRNIPGGGRVTTRTLAGGGRVVENVHPVRGGVVRSIRYGGGLAVNGSVERPGPGGTVTRTYVQGGRVAYARSYRQYVWQSYGRSYAYERVVPAFVFAGAYYGWAYRPWGRAVIYPWGWQAQPWFGVYGGYFTPYPAYASLDQWMTDSIIAQNMQAAYQANQPPSDTPPGAAPPAGDAPPADQAPPAQAAAPQNGAQPVAPQGETPQAAPPPVTPDVKEELDAQIKLELQEHEKGVADPTAQDTPSALKAGHVLFRIVSPLDVPTQAPNQFCSLSPNDYIKRVGDMGSDGTVPVQVRLSSASDCGEGLVTKVAMNDLMAMDSEQEAQVLNALQAASKGMGPHGLPQGPATSPIAVPDGQATPDSSALDTLRGQ